MTAESPPFYGETFVDLPPNPSYQTWANQDGFTELDAHNTHGAVNEHLTEMLEGLGYPEEYIKHVVGDARQSLIELITNAMRYKLTCVVAGMIPGDPENNVPPKVYVGAGDQNTEIEADAERPSDAELDEAEWGHGFEIMFAFSDVVYKSFVKKEDAHPEHRDDDVRTRKLVWTVLNLLNIPNPSSNTSTDGQEPPKTV